MGLSFFHVHFSEVPPVAVKLLSVREGRLAEEATWANHRTERKNIEVIVTLLPIIAAENIAGSMISQQRVSKKSYILELTNVAVWRQMGIGMSPKSFGWVHCIARRRSESLSTEFQLNTSSLELKDVQIIKKYIASSIATEE